MTSERRSPMAAKKSKPGAKKTKQAAAPRSLVSTDAYASCSPASFSFSSTAEAPELTEVIAQDRAVSAVDEKEKEAGLHDAYASVETKDLGAAACLVFFAPGLLFLAAIGLLLSLVIPVVCQALQCRASRILSSHSVSRQDRRL